MLADIHVPKWNSASNVPTKFQLQQLKGTIINAEKPQKRGGVKQQCLSSCNKGNKNKLQEDSKYHDMTLNLFFIASKGRLRLK